MDNEKFYIRNCMKAFGRKKVFIFGTPHNKRDKGLKRYFRQSATDIAGLPFADDYKNPKERIKKVQAKAARKLGTKESFFMTDGVTSGIYAKLYAVKDFGNSIIINRNANPAVFNACKMFGIEPIILTPNIRHGKLLPPKADDIEKVLTMHRRSIGVLLTYPDRYGMACDLMAIREKVNKAGKLLLVDGTYGSHFRFDDQMVYAGKYADLWIDGIYKTMPALNQGIIVNVGNQDILEKVREAVNTFRAETPNYAILASIEYALEYMSHDGTHKLEKLRQEIALLKKRLTSAKYSIVSNDDFTRVVIDCAGVGISSSLAEKYLASKNVYVDFSDGRYLVLQITPANSSFSRRMLEYFLKRLTNLRKYQNTYVERYSATFGVKETAYLSACQNENTELVDLDNATDRVVATNITIGSADFPILMAGERILAETVTTLKHLEDLSFLNGGKLLVIRDKNEG